MRHETPIRNPFPDDLDCRQLAAAMYHWSAANFDELDGPQLAAANMYNRATANLPLPRMRAFIGHFHDKGGRGRSPETKAEFTKRAIDHLRAWRKQLPKLQSGVIRAGIAEGLIFHGGKLYSRGCEEVAGVRFHDRLPDGTRPRVGEFVWSARGGLVKARKTRRR